MRSFKLRFLILLGIFTILFLTPKYLFAQSPEFFELPVQQTLPGNSKYFLKRLKEKITYIFKFSHQAKLSYRQELLEKRLSELVGLIEVKNANEIANSSQRFAYQAGILAEGSYNDKKENKEMIIALFEKYKPIMEKMRDNFPANSPFWLLTQQDIDTMNILSDRLK